MKLKITAAVVFCFLFFSGLYAMNWPGENSVLIRNFGANDRGRPVLGMVFDADVGSEILAAETGEVIFSRSRNNTASRLPSPLGAWTAIDHGDGLISIYSRYADEVSFSHERVERRQPIATAGTSGWSRQNGFYFIIFDRRERRWINPALILTPQQELRPPVIHSVELHNAQGSPVQLRNLVQGRYTIHVNAAGTAAIPGNPASLQQAPQKIVTSVNGSEVGYLNFESVSARDGVLMVFRNGLVPASRIYANHPSFEAADVFLNRGQATLEIIVQDITGNSRSIVNRLIVN
jgi:murein DD-endopeptidase MepM/ murein hydrolase activator NlpD